LRDHLSANKRPTPCFAAIRSFVVAFGLLLVLGLDESPLGLTNFARAQISPPAEGDDSVAALRAYLQQLEALHGGYRNLPLATKAAYFDWQLWRYHRTALGQISHPVLLATEPGSRPEEVPDRDASTWSGALLAALSYQYAVTHEPQTLARIADLVAGLHWYFLATGEPGLPARCVVRAGGRVPFPGQPKPWTGPDGVAYLVDDNPAKGGFNQLACGYTALLMHALDALPPAARRTARDDALALALHLIDHDYRATRASGEPTSFGDLTPLVGAAGVPFNAQVAYLVVALGAALEADDPGARDRLARQLRRLRDHHHAYYAEPWQLIQPQRAGVSLLLKGMNDRNHVANAAYYGLALELHQARRRNQPPDDEFLEQLGATLALAAGHVDTQRHSLMQFMWAGLLSDANVWRVLGEPEAAALRPRLDAALVESVEQLRRYRLDRFSYPGHARKTEALVWIDQFKPDDSYWKESPRLVWQVTGPATNELTCATDFLYAYWLLRYWRLDEYPALRAAHAPVLR
jgi:hypothetical protein